MPVGTKDSTLSVRLHPAERAALDGMARRRGAYTAQLAGRYIREGMRASQHAGIEFRDTPDGRAAYLRGHRLAVWQVMRMLRDDAGGQPARIARLLDLPPALIEAAVEYTAAYPEEVEDAIREADGVRIEDLRRLVPGLKVMIAGKGRRASFPHRG